MSKLQEEYSKLGQDEKLTLQDIRQSLRELEIDMEVDSEQKEQIIDFLIR